MWRVDKVVFILLTVCTFSCREKTVTPRAAIDSLRAEMEYIRPIPGKNDSLLSADVEKGKVLIAYSDCRTCHNEKSRSKGPAFEDVARRYPVNDGYIELLARKIIVGGSGAWGYPVMTAHPNVPVEDAKLMVKYILSLKPPR